MMPTMPKYWVFSSPVIQAPSRMALLQASGERKDTARPVVA